MGEVLVDPGLGQGDRSLYWRVVGGPANNTWSHQLPARSGRLRLLAHHLPRAPLGAQADLAASAIISLSLATRP
jgi:hypothetical protein